MSEFCTAGEASSPLSQLMIVSGTLEWRKWVQEAVGPSGDLRKGRAWQKKVLAILESVCPSSSHSPTVPSISQLAQMKGELVNETRQQRHSLFRGWAYKILSEPPSVILEMRRNCVGFYTGQRLRNTLEEGVVSPQQCRACPDWTMSHCVAFSLNPAAWELGGF